MQRRLVGLAFSQNLADAFALGRPAEPLVKVMPSAAASGWGLAPAERTVERNVDRAHLAWPAPFGLRRCASLRLRPPRPPNTQRKTVGTNVGRLETSEI